MFNGITSGTNVIKTGFVIILYGVGKISTMIEVIEYYRSPKFQASIL